MCGITGAYSPGGINEEALRSATDCLSHRGPDSHGYYGDETKQVFLGHRRLSVIDLSPLANQPMFSSSGRYVMVYNGEVYNFNELKGKLPGHTWKSHSDTEVILELFQHYGPACFAWLNGMFALSIYDRTEQRLFLCRDQVGIKPLFYYWDGAELVFASELKVIKRYCDVVGKRLAVNQAAIPLFLHLGFIPEPLSIYQDVHKFPSANYAVLERGRALSFHTYWDSQKHYLPDPVSDEQQALDAYRRTLFAAVEDQMVSDVPLGTFLSGGIDSSLVTAVAARVSAQKIKTFSIGFHEARYDETAYANAIARHLGTEHQVFKVSANDILALVPSLLQIYDEPFGDSSAFPTMIVSQMARKEVTVVLSGDGGDEMFQGYGMYAWANRLSRPWMRALRKPAFAATQMMGNRMKRGGALFNYPAYERVHTHIFSQEQYFFSEKELSSLLINPAFDFGTLNRLETTLGGNAADRQAFWDFNHYLKDDLLVKVDRASMRYSLETRVPLLDMRIIELALNTSYNFKVSKEYGTKHLMKRVLYEMVPRDLFERPKQGFSIPLKEWLTGPLKYLIDSHLNDETLREFNIVDVQVVKRLLNRFFAGEDYLYNRIWLLLVLHWWLKTTNDR